MEDHAGGGGGGFLFLIGVKIRVVFPNRLNSVNRIRPMH